jgi:hypothetical protein
MERKGGEMWRGGSLILRRHMLRFQRRSFCFLGHRPYSHDLTPADFWLFPKLKSVLKVKRFSDVEDINSSAKEIDRLSCSGF